ncbi:MAG: SMP-30/gluconolactonase/LRE family protein [Thermoplasmatota archaeon]
MRAALLALPLLVAAGASASLLGELTSPDPLSQPPCADGVEPELFFLWDSQLENLAFDDAGNLVVVDLHGERLVLLDGAGAQQAVLDLPATHGIVHHPAEGRFYAAGLLPDGTGPTDVVSFRIADGEFTDLATYAIGFDVVNGMAFGPDDALYVSSPLAAQAPYLMRIEPGGGPWAPWRDHYGPNGLWPADGGLYAAITGDQSSPIHHVPFDQAEPMETVALLSTGAVTLQPGLHAPSGPAASPIVLPKGLDDLTMGPDGMLYATAHVTGELLRVDPADGSACVLADGFEEPTSARFAPASFGLHGGDLFVTEMGGYAVTALYGPGDGAVWRLDLA